MKTSTLRDRVVIHDEIDIQEGMDDWAHSIIAKVFYEDTLSFGAAEKVARRIWKNIGDFRFSHHDKNMYIIIFEKEADYKFLLKKKYSSFNGRLVLMHHWDPLVDANTLNWDLVVVEFELRHPPQEYQSRAFTDRLRGFVGTVMDVDPPNEIPTSSKRVTVTALISVVQKYQSGKNQ